jgi:hypothetical protein
MDMDARTKITLAWELHQQGRSNRQIARDLALNHETVGNYIRSIDTLPPPLPGNLSRLAAKAPTRAPGSRLR